MKDERFEKTVIASIMFLDIIGYSKQPVAMQLDWKHRLNEHLSDAVSSFPRADRIILDTGDGAAVCFLGDPEDALIATLRFAKLADDQEAGKTPTYKVRIGINLGSIRVIKDINDQPNVVGDGINVGQRIMSFAEPGQILASRSYFEVVSCLTDEYMAMFRFLGFHHDKHVREHAIYEVIKGHGVPEPATHWPASPPADVPEPAVMVAHESAKGPFCEVVLEPHKLIALESLFLAHFGPIARTLIGRATKSPSSLAELCNVLGQNIPKQEERQRFLETALTILRNGSPEGSGTVFAQGETLERAKPAPVCVLPTEQVARIEKELAGQIGPIAKILVARDSGSVATFAELIEKCSAHIANDDERRKFVGRMKKLL